MTIRKIISLCLATLLTLGGCFLIFWNIFYIHDWLLGIWGLGIAFAVVGGFWLREDLSDLVNLKRH
jgi:hypothetical protein